MTVIPPVSGLNVGHTTGGGFLDTIKSAMAGATGGAGAAGAAGGATAATAGASGAAGGPISTKGDGSIGLFDGVLMKAGLGGAAGALAGWIMPVGGPIIGGIVGALGGAALGVFGNWKKMNDIKKQNQAILDQMGVATQDPQMQQILQSGQVQQLVPIAQQEMSAAGYVQQNAAQFPTTQTGTVGQYPVGGGVATDVSANPSTDTSVNPSTGVSADPSSFAAPLNLDTDPYPVAQADPTAGPNQTPLPVQAADPSIYTGQVPAGFPGSDQGTAPQGVGQAPPVPQAITADPTVPQNVNVGSIMGVQQASATLGDGTPVGDPSGAGQQYGIPPMPTGLGGGGAAQSAQVQVQLAQLQAQIDELEQALAQLPAVATGAAASTAAPSTQTAVPSAA